MRVNEVKPEHVEQWKRMFGAVYKIRISGQDFVIRPLLRHEMLQIQEWLSSTPGATVSQMDEKIVDYCLLSPDWKIADFLATPAGVLPTLSRRIQELSGFEDDPPVEELFNAFQFDPPAPEKLEEFKKQYKRVAVVRIHNCTFVVRALNRLEWDRLQRDVQESKADADFAAAKLALLYPDVDVLSDLPAGYVASVSLAVLRASGFQEEPEIEELL